MKNTFRKLAELMHRADPEATFAFELWDGERIVFGDHPRVTLRLTTRSAGHRILADGFLGFGEAYMAGEAEVEGDLQELVRLGLAIRFEAHGLSFSQKINLLVQSLLHRGTRRHARENIAFHYDLGEDFYSLYLDKTMTYSCAYFHSPNDSLATAQRNKYDHISRKLMLQPGESLLDIGCGWGGMIIHAATHYGVTGLGVTLSHHQVEWARQRIAEAGLTDRIRVEYRDYREVQGTFDKVVSIGMFEHVGRKFIPEFMERMTRRLKVGGLGLLHTIGKDAASPVDPWTLKYIFPGGYVPTLGEIVTEMGANGLSVLGVENLRLHYALTLDHWAENFERNIDRARHLTDEAFIRRWRLFLESAAAGFRYSDTRLFQVLFSRGLNNRLPLTREHIYPVMAPAATS